MANTFLLKQPQVYEFTTSEGAKNLWFHVDA